MKNARSNSRRTAHARRAAKLNNRSTMYSFPPHDGLEEIDSANELLDIFGGTIEEELMLEDVNNQLAEYKQITNQITLQTARSFQMEGAQD